MLRADHPRKDSFRHVERLWNNVAQCYSEVLSGICGTAMAYICNMCGHNEQDCLCERYCMICKSDNDPRLCSDGCYYCTDCREACDLSTEN